ncbi:hypothetical protein [Ktedonobacter racemifer]|uniref:hypothetical protein n=1 Tax=Ktedonobacter racemifer TaxID=363277 RepID=UPI003B75CCF3
MSKQETKKRQRQRTPNNRTTTGFRISDELWALLEPLLPVYVNTHRFGGGRPRRADRTCADCCLSNKTDLAHFEGRLRS